MAAIAGIKYTKSPKDGRHFLRVDLGIHGKNQLLEDFLDGLDMLERQGGETISLNEFNRYIDERVGMNV